MQMKAMQSAGSFHENYMLATEWNLAFVCAWYGSMGVLSRLGKSERSSYWGFMVGFGVVYALIACVGAIGSVAVSDMNSVYSTDPTEWFTQRYRCIEPHLPYSDRYSCNGSCYV